MGMMGMQQPTLTQEDVKKAVADQRMQDAVQELKTRALVGDLLSRTSSSGIAVNADLTASLAPKPEAVPEPESVLKVSDEELQKYKEERKAKYIDLRYKLGGLPTQLEDILKLIEEQGDSLLDKRAGDFCKAFKERVDKYLAWWRFDKEELTNQKKSELTKMIVGNFGLLIPENLRFTPTEKKDAQNAIDLYEYVKKNWILSSNVIFSIDTAIKFYKNARDSIKDDTPTVIPSTTTTADKDAPELGKGLPAVQPLTSGLLGSMGRTRAELSAMAA